MKKSVKSIVKRILGNSPGSSLGAAVHKNFPNWHELLNGKTIQSKERLFDSAKKRVLIATSIGGDSPSTTVESLLAVALSVRGAVPEVLLCDTALPACLRGNVNNYPNLNEFVEYGPKDKYCNGCFENSQNSFSSAGIKVLRYSDFITDDDKGYARSVSKQTSFVEIQDFRYNDMAIGEHALAGALRFFARGTLEGEPTAEPVLRRFLEAAVLAAFAVTRLLEARIYDVAVFSHGIYIPLGIVGEVARSKGVRVVNWVTAYRKQRFIFSHGDTYHHTMITEPVADWEKIQWSEQLDKQTISYLESRAHGTRDWIWFHEKPEEEMAKIASELGLDKNKPIIGLLTNVVWDAQLHFKANAFENMLEWIMASIEYFSERSDIQLVIRVHPAEIRGTVKSRQKVVDEINKRFDRLPANLYIIGPESPISTYAVMDVCDSVIIYGTKTGVELAARGIPVIVGGEAWVRGKGITMDANSKSEYYEILDRLPIRQRMDMVATERARKYAYHFFFRRMIPLPMLMPNEGFPPFKISLTDGFDDLKPGRSLGLDVVCQGILEGVPFIYPEEEGREEYIE
ncbi:capsule biosynthesis protein [Methylomonas sp. MED-D]|uniref:capsular polysaccharide export protein, LipB/KpsS family n=1 Tax=unclassified Methylomonas TaxID=2608980 RepID=UPI0028A468AA|nr:capsule biosynthesis protein [Methylomonas sp. MV1]MDT4328982.1 capsule biosynthesis protein [Methylomonas sp. MV1]